MTPEQEAINTAFENYLGFGFSEETLQTIAEKFGERIASAVHAIYNDAMNAPVDWRTATIDSALPVLKELFETKYPWLSADARKQINYAFIMTWK